MKALFKLTSLLVLAGTTWLSGCSKDDASPCDCVPLGLTRDSIDGYQHDDVYPIHGTPSFNPVGNGDFVYFKGNGHDDPAKLNGIWRAHLHQPGERQLPPTKDVQLGLHWGPRGRIAYNNLGGQIMTITSEGDSLQSLPYYILRYQPIWSPNGLQIACQLDGDRPQKAGLIILSDAGRQVEIISPKSYGYALSWAPDFHKLAVVYSPSRYEYGLGTYDFANHTFELVAQGDEAAGISSADWLADSRTIVWTAGNGIFKMDAETKRTTQLRQSCDSRLYMYSTVSPDGTTILVQRVDRQLTNDSTTIREESNLWAMDIDGSNERQVKL